jgi:hypothetical protein
MGNCSVLSPSCTNVNDLFNTFAICNKQKFEKYIKNFIFYNKIFFSTINSCEMENWEKTLYKKNNRNKIMWQTDNM